MSSSSPEEASEIRGQTLTPVSPKPLLYPSPTNIPILEKSMEPAFDDKLSQPGADLSNILHYPEPVAAYPASSDSDPYAEQAEGEGNGKGNSTTAAEADANDDYAQALAMEDEEVGNQDTTTTTESMAQPINSLAPAPSDTALVPVQPESTSATDLKAPDTSLPTAQEISQASKPPSTDNGLAAGVDFQAILDNLTANTPSIIADPNAVSASTPSNVPPTANLVSPTSTLAGNPNLPPRPPPQAGQVNFSPTDDIRNYHKIPSAGYRATNIPSIMTGSATGANGLPPPPTASFQQTPQSATQQSPADANFHQRDDLDVVMEDAEAPWGQETQKLYDDFLVAERAYVTEGQWDKFPPNSRLFIGNLPTEKVTKRDIFHIFYKHGQLAQISIKQAYGFVQFLDAESCYRALSAEQGQSVRGRKMHLEISKPQRPTKNQGGDRQRRRSRSPDFNRGGAGGRGPSGVDRYTSGGQSSSPRERDFRRRDDYRPNRSPSPRGHRGGRRDRSRERFDGRRKSRSRSPYGRRYRSPSPKRDVDDDLPLPRRNPRDVPDVQILVLDDLDRNFIAYIEKAFQDRGVRCDVLLLSPRLSEAAVIRRQILEGVLAVSKLTQNAQRTGRIPLQVFDRRAGVDNVRFEEYQDLEPGVVAELVLRAKQTHGAQQPASASYGLPPPPSAGGYGMPQQASYGLPPAQSPNATQILSSLNPQDLQKLLSAAGIQQPQTPSVAYQQQGPVGGGITPDLARLLASAGVNTSVAAAPQSSMPQQGSYSGGGQPDMQEIMANLAKYKR
ncbi:hypothetical protein NA57DRAFT_58715 [Rhizodiscina lignyota]|uniref:RRM domain-containing protein n=1 Tax=Rhizodiscina lignyota TaxID=1504668 RepID=A0A9P4IB65_9PEZI|nr:hypothetical protein NA57DRAFT_58715 [Rhizodiscina lignyota]